ncbi:alpha-galactosidase [Caproiciproducens galactitolivorans]|uniref:Alpha-galactosidase n=1 Tax=Caproiciproducens galactitolivorans TaxID=642589 RepID=A0ABT4BR69_9FIRM|nr:alpha-galactosidase [Caproiciproducens galactitolivorans]MCY1713295.1 alpha-galactosidase [Caproiciproducens galactitolivorans]
MAILYDNSKKIFTLQTQDSTYQFCISQFGYLLHLYYGRKMEYGDASGLIHTGDHGFCPCPNEAKDDRTFSLDFLPQEYPSLGNGDYRTPCLAVSYPNGSSACDLRYVSHRIFSGKPALNGLPALYCNEGSCETLEIILQDSSEPIEVHLFYSVFETQNAISRSCSVVNKTRHAVFLDSVLSCCMDFYGDHYDFMTFYGRHAMERSVERRRLTHGKTVVDSVRGASSHQQNPFVILCEPNADEDKGECYGISLLYSGNFAACAEVDQFDQTRFTMGINPNLFRWKLAPGESFQAPETVLSYSPEGLGMLSGQFHTLFRNNLCRGCYKDRRRPVLINNWEATYFDFNEDKLVRIAEEASKAGIELLVMDDGWFGSRNNDCTSLGDWTVNRKKLPNGLDGLCRKINGLGMKLGIWFEPEMVSENSELYRKHGEWCLRIPGRPNQRGRSQFVLDFSRSDVVDYLFNSISEVLHSANIEYVKWDMNRHLTQAWSAGVPAEREGEVYHRYVLGVYNLLERLLKAFPNILFEGCAGGGGRFDAGMLYYTPQIWCSDNTDAIDRLEIQYGTSFAYPACSMGSHVSACPNHQTGRSVPLKTRGIVAMSGAFGFELDLEKLNAGEKEEIASLVKQYKKYYKLIGRGNYYRLTDPHGCVSAWQFASADRKEALVNIVVTRARANAIPPVLKLEGLDEAKSYRIVCDDLEFKDYYKDCSGSALMNAGLRIPNLYGDYPSLQIHLLAEDDQ